MGITTLQDFPTFGQPSQRRESSTGRTSSPTQPSNSRHLFPLSPDASALESLPHLSSQVCFLWSQQHFEVYVNRLIMDSRDGKRQGLPWDAAEELLFLVELSIAKRALVASNVTGVPFREMYEQTLESVRNASGNADLWSDPVANREARYEERNRAHSKPAAAERQATKQKSWWRRLFG